MKQVVLWIGANAGGVSKTTLAVHIGYEMAKRGFDVVLLDLDTNVSMSQFCGLDKDPPLEQTIAAVFSEDFDGNWPLLMPEWGKPKGKLQISVNQKVFKIGAITRSFVAYDTYKYRIFPLADKV